MLSVPLVIAFGAIASHVVFPALHKPDAVLSQPVAVVTAWGWSGVTAWMIYSATMLLAGIAYGFAIARSRETPLIAILAGSALACCAALAFRFIFSSDVYAYAAYGALSATHHDPYIPHTLPPLQLVDAVWTHAIGFEWPSLPAFIYGPAFLALVHVTVVATHFDLPTTLIALRAIEIIAFVAAVGVAANAVPERGRLLAAIVGLNPVVISTVSDGHNDALVLLVVAIGALIALRKPEFGGFLAGASMMLKATGAVATIALAYVLRDRRFTLWGCVAIALSIVAQLIATHVAGGYRTAAATDFVGTGEAAIAIGIRGLIALGLVARALYNAARGDRAAALAAAALAIWALYPQDYPWYGMWLLPLAAFTLEQREGPVLVLLTFSSTLRYLSDAYGFAPAAPWLELIALVTPLAGYLREPLPT
jgi:hypothetical protein